MISIAIHVRLLLCLQVVLSALRQPLPFKLGLGIYTTAKATEAHNNRLENLKAEVASKQVAAVNILECDLTSVPDAIQPMVRLDHW